MILLILLILEVVFLRSLQLQDIQQIDQVAISQAREGLDSVGLRLVHLQGCLDYFGGLSSGWRLLIRNALEKVSLDLMKRICRDVLVLPAVRHLEEVVLCQGLLGFPLLVERLDYKVVVLLLAEGTSALVEVSLKLLVAGGSARGLCGILLRPVLEAVTHRPLLELVVLKADRIHLGLRLRCGRVMGAHIHAEILDACYSLLPIQSLLRVVYLRQIGSQVAPGRANFEFLLLIEYGPGLLSIFLWRRRLLGRLESVLSPLPIVVPLVGRSIVSVLLLE